LGKVWPSVAREPEDFSQAVFSTFLEICERLLCKELTGVGRCGSIILSTVFLEQGFNHDGFPDTIRGSRIAYVLFAVSAVFTPYKTSVMNVLSQPMPKTAVCGR
jgi:hypothetical protein